MSAAAARLGDPISHSSAMGGLLTGLAVGAGVALAGVAVVTTGGLAAAPIMATVAAVGAGASAGAGLGQMVGGNNTSETGILTTGSPNVRINGQSAARASADFTVCSKHHHGRNPVASGSDGVRINGYPAARVGDQTECGGTISAGSENVRIGGSTVRNRTINPEVPPWLQWTILGVGLASTGYFLAVAPVITTGGIAGGFAGEKGGRSLGGRLYGEGSTGQAYMALGGAVIGGGIGARGAQSFNSRYTITVEGLGSNFGNLRVRPINGRIPINSARYANTTVPLKDLPSKIRGKYPHSVPFSGAGFPDFSRYSIRNVKITLGPSRKADFARADKAAGFNRSNPKPHNYTWHHHQEKGYMQLVPTDIHKAIKHTGGVAVQK